jgi:hypothetical protein
MPTKFICAPCTILRTNIDFIPKQRQLAGICNGTTNDFFVKEEVSF